MPHLDLTGVISHTDHDRALSVIYEPGNGTSYDVTFTDVGDGYWLVSLPEFGACYRFVMWDAHPAYIAQKLRLSYADGEALARLFAAVHALTGVSA